MDPRESFLIRPDVSDVNGRGIEFTRIEIAEYCVETIDLVFAGVSRYLEADQEFAEELDRKLDALFVEQGELPEDETESSAEIDREVLARMRRMLPSGEVLGVFVQQANHLTSPNDPGNPLRTFFTRIEPEATDDDGRNQGDEVTVNQVSLLAETLVSEEDQYMFLHVPVGDLSIHDHRMPEQSDVDEVYLEVVDGDTVRWFCIQKAGFIREYIPQGYETDELNASLEKRQWSDVVKTGVPEAHGLINKLFDRIVDWKTVPQAYRTIK